MQITKQTEGEIELLCLKAYNSVDCPIKQEDIVKKRAWLKNKIMQLIGNLNSPEFGGFEPRAQVK